MDSKTLQTLRRDAEDICRSAIEASVPDAAIQRALAQLSPCQGRTVLVSIGKAGWQTAKAAYDALGSTIEQGVVVTKYGHSQGPIGGLAIYEAGHPVPDEHSVRATEAALAAVSGLCARDRVLFLVSGGGSALFERPLVPLAELEDITGQMLACGADITQINTIRKRLSGVKGGRFAQLCAPAHVYAILLSDVIGDPPDMIASGPAYPDSTTTAQAMALVSWYGLTLSPQALDLLEQEPPKVLDNVTTVITGSVAQLCRDAAARAEALGYRTCLLTDRLQCEAREAGRFLSAMAGTHAGKGEKTAYILGGETVVHLTGHGLGGRNQELALAAAEGLAGLEAVVASVGSDGTDGPTDAAGGITDGATADALAAIFELVRFANTHAGEESSKAFLSALKEKIVSLSDVLGLIAEKKEEMLDADIEALIEERQAARKARNFARADEIRNELLSKGIVLEDTREGVKWKRA